VRALFSFPPLRLVLLYFSAYESTTTPKIEQKNTATLLKYVMKATCKTETPAKTLPIGKVWIWPWLQYNDRHRKHNRHKDFKGSLFSDFWELKTCISCLIATFVFTLIFFYRKRKIS